MHSSRGQKLIFKAYHVSGQVKKKLRLSRDQKYFPKLGTLTELCNELGSGPDRAVIPVRQLHGTMVNVPPGYIHMVYNLSPCLKVSFPPFQLAHGDVPWYHCARSVMAFDGGMHLLKIQFKLQLSNLSLGLGNLQFKHLQEQNRLP